MAKTAYSTAPKTLVPSPRFGVAALTALYPCLSFGAPRVKLALARAPHGTSDGRMAQFVLAEEPLLSPDRELLDQAQRAGRRSIVAPWALSESSALELVSGLDPALTRLLTPPNWLDERLAPYAAPFSAIAALPELDRLVRSRFGLPAPGGAPAPSVGPGPIAIGFAAHPGDLTRMAPALRSSLPASHQLVVVSPRPSPIEAAMRDLGLDGVVLDETNPHWLELLPRAKVALVSARTPDQTPGLLAAAWTLTALRARVPVVGEAHPLLEDIAGSFVSNDWERGLALYLNETCFRSTDAALGQAHARRLSRLDLAGRALRDSLATTPRRTASSASAGAASPPLTLMAFIDLPQDMDVCLPLLLAVRERGRLRVRIVVTDWLETEAPRTLPLLQEARFTPEVVRRKLAIAGELDFSGVDAFIAPSATNQPAHRAGYRLTRLAEQQGVVTFTLQHGFENIGLTYRDESPTGQAGFASRHVFTWCAKENLPEWVPVDTRQRVIGVGSPKLAPQPSPAIPLIRMDTLRAGWSRTIGVFENLHWRRYSEDYVQRFLDDLAAAADRQRDALFLVKPHSAGRWMNKNPDRSPARPNIFLIDPLHEDWRRFTAPDLIVHLDGVITTPSTVAVDAVRAGKPVAVIGDPALALDVYAPLPILQDAQDWVDFIGAFADRRRTAERNEVFLRRHFLPQRGDWRIAELMWTITAEAGKRPRPQSSRAA